MTPHSQAPDPSRVPGPRKWEASEPTEGTLREPDSRGAELVAAARLHSALATKSHGPAPRPRVPVAPDQLPIGTQHSVMDATTPERQARQRDMCTRQQS